MIALVGGFGISYLLAPYFTIFVSIFLLLHYGPSDPNRTGQDIANQAWWISFIGVGVLLFGGILRSLKVNNVIDHLSDKADEQKTQ